MNFANLQEVCLNEYSALLMSVYFLDRVNTSYTVLLKNQHTTLTIAFCSRNITGLFLFVYLPFNL